MYTEKSIDYCENPICESWFKKKKFFYLNKLRVFKIKKNMTSRGVVKSYLNQGRYYKKLDEIFQFNKKDPKYQKYKIALYDKYLSKFYKSIFRNPLLDRYLGMVEESYTAEFRIYIVSPSISQQLISLKKLSENNGKAVYQAIVKRNYSCTPRGITNGFCYFKDMNEIFKKAKVANIKKEKFLQIKKWKKSIFILLKKFGLI